MMPWRAKSIIPALIIAPIRTPAEAKMSTVLNPAARAPTAEFRKLTGVVAYADKEAEDCQNEQKDHNC